MADDIKQIFMVSDNPLARNVAALVKALTNRGIKVSSLKTNDKIKDVQNSIIHCIGMNAARKTKGFTSPRVITLSEKPGGNFITRGFQKSAIRGAKLIATSEYVGKLWKVRTIIRPGLNLDIFNPSGVPARRQTDILEKYNIPHDKRMIVCASPAVASLPHIIAAVKNMTRQDFIVAMLGNTSRSAARKMLRDVAGSAPGKILFIGEETDIPSLLKAAFATISITNHEHLAASIAMGTPTIAANTEFAPELAANFKIKPNHPAELTRAINSVLDLTQARAGAICKANAKYAAENLSVIQTAEKYAEIYSKL